jgi:hypothetical protein
MMGTVDSLRLEKSKAYGGCKKCGQRYSRHGVIFGRLVCGGVWLVINEEAEDVWEYSIGEWRHDGDRLVNKRDGGWVDEWSINGNKRKFKRRNYLILKAKEKRGEIEKIGKGVSEYIDMLPY